MKGLPNDWIGSGHGEAIPPSRTITMTPHELFVGGWNAALYKAIQVVKEKTGDRELVEALYDLTKAERP